MEQYLKVLLVHAQTGFYRIERFKLGDYFGPIDLGLYLSGKYNSLNIGVGLLAGSILPGSNRLIFNGFSPCWRGFFISSMGGAGLVFDNLGINMLSIIGKANTPSVLYLNRNHAEEIHIEIQPLAIDNIWNEGRKGVYGLMDHVYRKFGSRYENDPRILAVGASSASTDFGAVVSVPVSNGKLTYIDTWAGRGGFGSKMFQEHGLASIIYGGTHIDEDFRDRRVADEWFINKYQKKLAAKDIEATTKYRFDPNFDTGGTFGVNYATMKGNLLAFNYRSIYWSEAERLKVQEEFIVNHYLKQFNEETIKPKQQKNCGEPCVAVCKKMNNEYKKDYEPYQTMGPLCGIFDQRAAEKVNHYADMLGFDAISVGGVLSWLMECAYEGYFTKEELGISAIPVFDHKNFRVIEDSNHNAKICIELLDSIVNKTIILDFADSARKSARLISKKRGKKIIDAFVFNGFARKGWMVPNQYWVPGVLSPMAIMGKYYMNYNKEFIPPRKLGNENAKRMIKELIVDNTGFCRFHRNWAEDMIPDIIDSLYGMKDKFLDNVFFTSCKINSRNSSTFWESERNIDLLHTFLIKKKEIEKVEDENLDLWIEKFKENKYNAALDFWYDIHKGIHETFREF